MKRAPRLRRLLRWAAPLVFLAAAAGGWVGLLRPAGRAGVRDVPTFEVRESPFDRTITAEGVLKPIKTTALTAPAQTQEALMIAWMLSDGDTVKKGDPVVRFDSEDLTRKLADVRDDRIRVEGSVTKEKSIAAGALHDRDRSAALTASELDRSRQLGKKDPRFFPRAEVIESEIDEGLYQSRLDHAKSARKVEQRLAASKLDLLAIERRKADLLHGQAAATQNNLEVRAPHDGTVMLSRWDSREPFTAGDRVYPRMRIAEISANNRMDAEVFVFEADAGGLATGKAATVVLEARPDVVWRGRVKKVDPLPKPRQRDIPAQYFGTLIELEGDTSGLKPGQRLSASITLDRQDKALAVPRQAVFRRDQDTVVYIRSAGRFEPVKVKLGPGTVGRLVITKGVKPGDKLALRDPTLTADATRPRAPATEPRAPSLPAPARAGPGS